MEHDTFNSDLDRPAIFGVPNRGARQAAATWRHVANDEIGPPPISFHREEVVGLSDNLFAFSAAIRGIPVKLPFSLLGS